MTNADDNDILKSSLEARGNNRYKQNPKTGKLEGSYPLSSVKGNSSNSRNEDLKYISQANNFTKELRGDIAYDGTTVKRVTCHAARRMIERNVSVNQVRTTIKKPGIIYPSIKHKNCKVLRNDDTAVVFSDSGDVVTVINLGD